MNKQELIDNLESLSIVKVIKSDYHEGFCEGVCASIESAKQLDEPKKVIVPQVVADWIKYAKQQGYGFMQSYDPIYMSYPINDGLDKWIDDHEETFARAWLDGYEVMKEPLYYVKLPEIGYMRFGKKYFYSTDKEDAKRYTENQIKSIDERYWPFCCESGEE